MKCSVCGQDNPAASSFCGSCGAKFVPVAPQPNIVFDPPVQTAKSPLWIPIVAALVLLALGAGGFFWMHGRTGNTATLELGPGAVLPSQVQKGQNCSFGLIYKSSAGDAPQNTKMVVETPGGTISIPGKTEDLPVSGTKITWAYIPESVASYRYHFEATASGGTPVRYPSNASEDLQLLASEPTVQKTAEAKTSETVDELRQRLTRLERKTSGESDGNPTSASTSASPSVIEATLSGRLTESDLAGKSGWELTLMRNTIYAHHGYRFHRIELQRYFSRQAWYQPDTNEESVVQGRMTPLERYNAALIANYQRTHGLVSEIPGRVLSASESPMPARNSNAAGQRRPVICIDPGHPSDASRGTQGRRITEIRADWLVALRLKFLLESRGASVVLTKNSQEQFVTNKERAEIANRCGADLMVRLHCDDASGSGIATYFPDRSGVRGDAHGPSPEIIAESSAIAPYFHQALVRSLRGVLLDRGAHSDLLTAVGSKQGALTGSIFSKVPVVLVEMCVLTNQHDEDLIVSEQGQERIAEALYEGVRSALGVEEAGKRAGQVDIGSSLQA